MRGMMSITSPWIIADASVTLTAASSGSVSFWQLYRGELFGASPLGIFLVRSGSLGAAAGELFRKFGELTGDG